jgi:PAS domain S-box-containing protein
VASRDVEGLMGRSPTKKTLDQSRTTEVEGVSGVALNEVSEVTTSALTEFLDTTDNVVTQVDGEGRFLFVNRAAAEVFGLPRDECLGLLAFEFIHPDDRDATQAAFGSWVADRSRSVSFENRQVSRDGSVQDLLWTINPQYETDGELTSIWSFATVITERKRADKILRESEERFRLLVDAITAVAWVTDGEGQFVEHQHEWEAYTGQAWEQHKGFGWAESIHPDDRPRVAGGFGEAVAAVKPFESAGRIWCEPAKEYHYFEVKSVPRLGPDGSVAEWLGTVVDVHARREAEEALKRHLEHLDATVAERTDELRRANAYNRSLIDAGVDPLFTVGSDGAITDVNPATEQITGLHKTELMAAASSSISLTQTRRAPGFGVPSRRDRSATSSSP